MALSAFGMDEKSISTVINTTDAEDITHDFNPFIELVKIQELDLANAYPQVEVNLRNINTNEVEPVKLGLKSRLIELKDALGMSAEDDLVIEDYGLTLTEKDNKKRMFQFGIYNNVTIAYRGQDNSGDPMNVDESQVEEEGRKDFNSESRFLSKEQADAQVLSSEQDAVGDDDQQGQPESNKEVSENEDVEMSGVDIYHAIPVDADVEETPTAPILDTKDETASQRDQPDQQVEEYDQQENQVPETQRSPLQSQSLEVTSPENNEALEASVEDKLYTITIRGTDRKYELQKDEKLQVIFDDLQKSTGKPVFFKFGENLIRSFDSPGSIGAIPNEVASFRILPREEIPKISFRLRTGDKELYFKVKEGVKLRKVFKRFLEGNGYQPEEIVFKYKGIRVWGDTTTIEIGLKSGDIIEAMPALPA